MSLRFWRCPEPTAAPVRLSSPAEIAVLEYDLYGVEPKPGTLAAAMVNLRALSPNCRPGPLDLADGQETT